MESHAKVAGHAIHQQLIVFPLGLLATAVVFDILRLLTGHTGFAVASYYMIGAGVLSGLVAAVFGLIDYLAIPGGTRAKRVGLWHGVGNVVVVVLFGLSWLLRSDQPRHVPTTLAFILALLGAVIAIGTGWLGGELVNRLGVGVDPDAHLDAPRPTRPGSGLVAVRHPERRRAQDRGEERLPSYALIRLDVSAPKRAALASHAPRRFMFTIAKCLVKPRACDRGTG